MLSSLRGRVAAALLTSFAALALAAGADITTTSAASVAAPGSPHCVSPNGGYGWDRCDHPNW